MSELESESYSLRLNGHNSKCWSSVDDIFQLELYIVTDGRHT